MISATVLGTLLAAAQIPNALAPALAGQRLCSMPDETNKTCSQLDSFRPLGGGRYSNVSETRVVLDGLAFTFTMTTVAVEKDDAICGTLRPGELASGRLKVTGRIPAHIVRAAITEAFKPYLNKEACSVFDETPEGLVMRTAINGVPDQGLDGFVKWVGESDGYRLP